jgi:hypothetical protein
MSIKYTKCALNIPIGRKIPRPNGCKIYQRLQLQDPPKFTQIEIFRFENIPSGNPALTGIRNLPS